MAEAKVTGPGVLDMKLLAAKLKDADPALKRNLRRQFKDAAGPVAEDVRQSILAMPSHHDGTLRAETARTVVVRTSFSASGVRVNIDSLGQRMPQGKGTLPRHLDSAKGWKHPTWGHRDRWVRQRGKPEWFEGPVIADARGFRDAALKAIAETERHLGA